MKKLYVFMLSIVLFMIYGIATNSMTVDGMFILSGTVIFSGLFSLWVKSEYKP